LWLLQIVFQTNEAAMNQDLRAATTHFEFGQNWSDYAGRIGPAEIAEAERGILALLPRQKIEGARVLDIGSGSGLHSLAFARLGAGEITALDIDVDSVATTKRVLSAHGVKARVDVASVFDLSRFGTFDIVYSWGVLHHTGDMWAAVKSASQKVALGGVFVIALYQKTLFCGAWTVEKRLYTAAPKPIRSLLSGIYGIAKLASLAVRGINPIAHVKNYGSTRGMSFWHDVHDWMGGYPYESATPAETETYVTDLGFDPIKIGDLRPGSGFFGPGCAEYVFRRHSY
jgi:2-polyprenyl-3-methyl-5-hydroxy-6-metoxy-1,4-benzoquinol methylase